jgi:hypothetical protein
MLDILSVIPGKKRHTPSGWVTFNGVCCHNRGHKADTRSRAGVKFIDDGFQYHCFNCQFKCGFVLGRHFSSNLKLLLAWCDLDKDVVDKLSFESFSKRSLLDTYHSETVQKTLKFNTVTLPPKARPLDPIKDSVHVEYLQKRGLKYHEYPYHVMDNESRLRIIIPYYHLSKIVGYTSRFYDNKHPKYVSEQQQGYVFNLDNQKPEHSVCVLVEGQFDAISIGGCAFMGNNISDDQATLLKSLRRTIIFVPDRDKTGMEVCGRALELGFKVSIPDWDDNIKDVNDAVKRYGKLATLLSILQHATSSKIIVEMKRKKIK